MGELEGQKGAWGYVKGGMGALSEAIAGAARSHGASIFTDKVGHGLMFLSVSSIPCKHLYQVTQLIHCRLHQDMLTCLQMCDLVLMNLSKLRLRLLSLAASQ